MERRGAALPGEPERVYRPLLFQSKGYASSELFRDAFEMRARMQPGADADAVETGEAESWRRPRGGAGHPRIRLETLSSRAATTVLSITYLSFLLALALPYLQSQGFLETVVTLPGGYCGPPPHSEPCITVDKQRGTARWTAYVANVSWYAGSMELKLRVDELLNDSALAVAAVGADEFALQQLDRIGEAWRLSRIANQDGYISDGSKSLKGADLGVQQEGHEMHYGYELYGIDASVTPYTRTKIAAESNQSVWVSCHDRLAACDPVKLFEITQDHEGLRGNGYGQYQVAVTFDGLYPNTFGKKVFYDFAYTKPSVHASEVIVRGVFLLSSILALPAWLIAVINSHGSWADVLSVQKWVLGLGVVLILWQNPVYAVTEMARTVSLRTRFVSISCESFAEAFFYVFWLNLLDQHAGESALTRRGSFVAKALLGLAMFAVDTAMTMIRMPSLFFANETSVRALLSLTTRDELYTLLGFIRIGLLIVWLTWIAVIGVRTGHYLRALPYMATRFKQLSFRFLFLETLLILIYVFVLSALQVFYLCQTWYLMGYSAFIQDSVHTFAKLHTGSPSLGKFLFLSVYVYLVMFVHLPPRSGESTGLLGSTAFHVEERPRLDSYGFLTPDSNLFCVETAKWMLELAWQAYFDPPGKPSPSGYGELTLERFGFELITHLRSSLTDTHVVVALSQGDRSRLVIAFRGTTSKQNWKSNLRFDQRVLWIKSRGLRRRRRTCMEVTKDVAARIPVLNMTLPRVHRGFWIAYESVRNELREVVRLILDENPGVSVYLTGHSMGGALAILGAYDLAVNFNMKVNMYNFGGPRVGNPSFRHLYDKCVPTSYRVVMDGDIVPGVPKFWGLYQHVGTEIAVDVEGNLIVDPSFVERHLHASSKRKLTMHGTNVYRVSLAKCLENLS